MPASLTAAGKQITDPSKAFRNTFNRNDSTAWQEETWHFVETIGELRYYVGWRAASVSRCRMIASEIDPETGKPTGTCDDPRVNDIVRDIGGGGATGQAQMLKRLAVFLTAPGDGYVAMIVRDPKKTLNPDSTPLEEALAATIGVTEEWLTLSREELKQKGTSELQLSLPDGALHIFDPATDLLFRIWEPNSRVAHEADSPVKAALPALREIERTTATIDNASKSRLVGNGIMFVPQEMSLPAQSAPGAALPDDGGIEGGPAGIIEPWAPATSQDLQDLLFDVATTAYKDQDSMAAFLPVIASVPGEWTKNVTHLKFDSTVSETALKTRDAAIRRLAMSLDVAPERLLGMGANSNHWSAWAIGEDDVKIHVVPVLETICAAMDQFILRRKLVEIGIDPDLYTVWYDTTGLTQDPDKKKEAIDAFDRGALSRAGLLQFLGFSEEDGYDLNTREGWVALAKDKAADDITLLPMLASLIGGDVADMASATPPAANADARTPVNDAPAKEEPEEPEDTSNEDDGEVEVEASAFGLAKMCANRAMELAANRRMSRADSKIVGNLPKTLAHTRLGVFTGNPFPLIEGWNSIIDGPTLIAAGYDPARFHQAIERAAIRALSTGLPVNVSTSALRKAIL